MNIEFKVPSSSSDSDYLVTICNDEAGVLVTCSCPAGTYGKLCKHKLQVLTECIEDKQVVVLDSDRVSVCDMLQDTEILALLRAFSAAEQDLVRVKRALELAKRNLEMALRGKVEHP
ncbi:MAG: hypothetical protein NT159_13090 [Proteobacteria bacterium]|nr:hypothetical protein [Pseudomonadota bacterium]